MLFKIFTKLGDIAISEKGKKPITLINEKKSGYIPYINIEAFEKKVFNKYTDGYGCRLCDEGDVLIVWDGSRSGLVGRAYKGAIGSTIAKIQIPYIKNDYLYYFLIGKYLILNTRTKGTGTPHVDPAILWNFDFPIISNVEQTRIVEKIEELFSDLDKATEDLKKTREQLKIYRQAVLKAAFEGKLTEEWRKKNNPKPTKILLQKIAEDKKNQVSENYNRRKINKDSHIFEEELNNFSSIPNTWKWIKINDISYDIQYGYTEAASINPIGPRFLRITDIQNNKVKWNKVPYCKINNIEKEKYILKNGDILFARTGATVGKSYLIKGLIPESIFASYLIRLKLSKLINKLNVFYFFQSLIYWKQIKSGQVGTGQPNFNGTKLGQLMIPLCTYEEQDQIVQEIESRLSVCDKLEETVQQSLNKIEYLRQSILKKAFEGKLVPQDPNDLPAGELLKQIKNKKDKMSKNGK
jgi:type I restriction enzyme S subunit